MIAVRYTYDQDGVYGEIGERHPDAAVIVPPRASAVPSKTAETAPTQRDRHLQLIAERGRMGWQKASGYKYQSALIPTQRPEPHAGAGTLELCSYHMKPGQLGTNASIS